MASAIIANLLKDSTQSTRQCNRHCPNTSYACFFAAAIGGGALIGHPAPISSDPQSASIESTGSEKGIDQHLSQAHSACCIRTSLDRIWRSFVNFRIHFRCCAAARTKTPSSSPHLQHSVPALLHPRRSRKIKPPAIQRPDHSRYEKRATTNRDYYIDEEEYDDDHANNWETDQEEDDDEEDDEGEDVAPVENPQPAPSPQPEQGPVFTLEFTKSRGKLRTTETTFDKDVLQCGLLGGCARCRST